MYSIIGNRALAKVEHLHRSQLGDICLFAQTKRGIQFHNFGTLIRKSIFKPLRNQKVCVSKPEKYPLSVVRTITTNTSTKCKSVASIAARSLAASRPTERASCRDRSDPPK